MDVIRTLGVAIDPSAAKSGGAAASTAFNDVGKAAVNMEKGAQGARKAVDDTGKSMQGASSSGAAFRAMMEKQVAVLSSLEKAVGILSIAITRQRSATVGMTSATDSAAKSSASAAAAADKQARAHTAAATAARSFTQTLRFVMTGTDSAAASADNAARAYVQLWRAMQQASRAPRMLGAGGIVGGSGMVPYGSTALAMRQTGSAATAESALWQYQTPVFAAGAAAASARAMRNVTPMAYTVDVSEAGQSVSWLSKLRSAFSSLKAPVGGMVESMKNLASNIRLSRGEGTSFIDSLVSMKAAIAALGLAILVHSFYDTAVSMQRLRNQLSYAASSAAEGAKDFEFLRAASAKLGLDLKSAGDAFGQFAASAKGKLTDGQIRDAFLSISEASTAMGLSAAQTSQTIIALGQMLSKGTVQAQELKLQLGNALPGAFALSAQAMGVTEKAMNKMLDSGNIVASQFVPKLAAKLHEAFGPASVQGAKNLQAEMNRLKTAWTELQAVIMGEGGEALFGKVLISARSALNEIRTDLGALIESNKEGNLADAMASAIRVGVGKGVNYLGGFMKGLSDTFGKVGQTLFTPEYLSALLRSFQSIAAAFGLAMLEALKKPISYLQAEAEMMADRWGPNQAAKVDAEALRRAQAANPRFATPEAQEAYKRTFQNGFFGQLFTPPTAQQVSLAKEMSAAIQREQAGAAASLGFETFDQRQARYEQQGVSFGGQTLAQLKATNQENMNAALKDLASPTAKMIGDAVAGLKGMQPLNIVDTSADEAKLRAYASRSKNPFVPPPGPVDFTNAQGAERERKGFELGMKTVADQIDASTEGFKRMENIGTGTADAIKDGFGDFTDSLVTDFSNIGKAFREMTAGILQDIAKIVLRQTVAMPLASSLIGSIGGVFGSGASFFGAPAAASGAFSSTLGAAPTANISFHHTGGIVGSSSTVSRQLPTALFHNAPRFHDGLNPDEFPAILQRGEKVIPKNKASADSPIISMPITVTVNGSDGGSDDDNRKFGSEVARQIQGMVDQRIQHALRPGSLLRRSGR